MRGSDFTFDSVHFLYHKFLKVNFRHGGSYIDSPDWIKKKIAAVNPRNADALNYEQFKLNAERVSNIKPFISKHKWKGINYLSKIDYWKMFEKNNNRRTVLNISYIKEFSLAFQMKKRKDGIILQ